MAADAGRSVADYRALAAEYDRRTRLINAIRLDAVAALGLRPGDVVLDVACGSGFSFPAILDRIGTAGRLIAFDHSPELLALARSRSSQSNLLLLEANAEWVNLQGSRPTALLFSYAHDVLQSEAALANLFAQAAPGARVVACGSVLWPAWAFPVNVWLRARHRRYITNMENFDRPWAKLERWLDDFRVARRGPGWRYLATGVLRPVQRSAA